MYAYTAIRILSAKTLVLIDVCSNKNLLTLTERGNEMRKPTTKKLAIRDVLGIMSDGLPLSSAKHFNVGDGWEILMSGEELRRAKTLQRVAITRAEIQFSSEENLLKFLEILRESDERLSRVPDEEVMYDWQMPRVKDLTVRFGVTWYNKDFFADRKDAYLTKLHTDLFKQFGIKAKDMRIEHIPL